MVTGDLMHHALQVREPGWFTIFDWDADEAVRSRRSFFASVADTDTLILPIHFPASDRRADRIGRWRTLHLALQTGLTRPFWGRRIAGLTAGHRLDAIREGPNGRNRGRCLLDLPRPRP